VKILLIILFIFVQGDLLAKEFKWKFKERITHENYYEAIGTGTKKVKINGKNKKIKFQINEFYPLGTELNEKKGNCKDFRIQEISMEGSIIEKNYSLNDCLPCIEKGSGYLCSYPYYQVFYRYSDYAIFDEDFKAISNNKDVTEDGAKLVYISINIGSREQVRFYETLSSLEGLGLGEISFYNSQIFKFNTRLRKIQSEKSEIKKTQSKIFQMVFNRIKNDTLKNIENKTKIDIREKDLKILFSAEPSLSIVKFQTRD
jgi:hypothetical protein